MELSYFYGQQSEQFSFFRIPKVLFTHERYRHISAEAKVLYGIFLDRMGLSAKNGWLDEKSRVYIIFTIEEIMENMGCGNKKAGQMLTELEKGGLIVRKRQGLGRPNLIYVMNFITDERVSDGNFQKCQNDTSGSVKMTSAEVSKRHGNNTDINKTEYSDTDLIYPSGSSGDRQKNRVDGMDKKDTMDRRNSYRSYFMDSLGFEYLVQDHPGEKEALEGILTLLVDTCCSNRDFIRISGDDKPAEAVKSRFMNLNGEHIRYVLKCLRENTTRIRNVRQYLMAALYNAPDTMSTYYQSWVNSDMASGTA